MADRVTNNIVTMAMASIQTVSLPECSRLQDNPVELRKSALLCIRLSSTVSLPALAGLAAVSGPLMATVGLEWGPAANVLKSLSVLGMLVIFAYFTGPLLQALSRPRQLAVLEWARMAVGTGILVVAGLVARNGSLSRQIIGIALARFVTGAFLVTPIFLYIFVRLCGISVRDFINAVALSTISSACVVGSVMLFNASGWLADDKHIILLIAEVAIGVVAGLAALFSLDTQLRRSTAGVFQRSFGRDLISKEVT